MKANQSLLAILKGAAADQLQVLTTGWTVCLCRLSPENHGNAAVIAELKKKSESIYTHVVSMVPEQTPVVYLV